MSILDLGTCEVEVGATTRRLEFGKRMGVGRRWRLARRRGWMYDGVCGGGVG